MILNCKDAKDFLELYNRNQSEKENYQQNSFNGPSPSYASEPSYNLEPSYALKPSDGLGTSNGVVSKIEHDSLMGYLERRTLQKSNYIIEDLFLENIKDGKINFDYAELIRDEKKEVTDVIKNIEETLEKLDKLKDDLKYKEK